MYLELIKWRLILRWFNNQKQQNTSKAIVFFGEIHLKICFSLLFADYGYQMQLLGATTATAIIIIIERKLQIYNVVVVVEGWWCWWWWPKKKMKKTIFRKESGLRRRCCFFAVLLHHLIIIIISAMEHTIDKTEKQQIKKKQDLTSKIKFFFNVYYMWMVCVCCGCLGYDFFQCCCLMYWWF